MGKFFHFSVFEGYSSRMTQGGHPKYLAQKVRWLVVSPLY
jgi:hypothetical protein